MPERPRQRVAARERQHHAGEGDRERGAADAQELLEIGFEADLEEEQDHADLREQEDPLGQRHEPEHRGAQHDAREQLAEHRGLAHPLGEAAEELGAEERGREGDQECTDVDAVLHARGS